MRTAFQAFFLYLRFVSWEHHVQFAIFLERLGLWLNIFFRQCFSQLLWVYSWLGQLKDACLKYKLIEENVANLSCLLNLPFFFYLLKEELFNCIIFGRHQSQSREQIFAARFSKVNSLRSKPHSGQQSTMQGSYFHQLFLLCIWLSVKAPQLGCDAVSISGQEDRAAANQCWQKCSLAANVSRSTAKAFEVSYSFHGKHMS